jgi:hypothetical protein
MKRAFEKDLNIPITFVLHLKYVKESDPMTEDRVKRNLSAILSTEPELSCHGVIFFWVQI